jgi:hypothetical protein
MGRLDFNIRRAVLLMEIFEESGFEGERRLHYF